MFKYEKIYSSQFYVYIAGFAHFMTMHKIIFLFPVISVLLLSCEKDEDAFSYGKCYEGVVIGYEECLESTLIQLHGIDYGKTIVYHDDQSPSLRALYGPYETPIVVITEYSQTKCP